MAEQRGGLGVSVRGIVVPYAALAGVWILVTDVLAQGHSPTQTVKGLLFVGITSLLLYLLLRRRESRLAEAMRVAEESEAHFRSLLESSGGFAVYRLAIDPGQPHGLRVVLASPAIEEILGIEDRMQFEQWLAAAHADDLPRLEQAIRESIQTGRLFIEEARLKGTFATPTRWVKAVASAVYDAKGRSAFFNGVMLDITERKENENKFRETSERLKTLIDASPSAIVQIDPQGKVLMWNRAAEEIFGWRAEEVVSRVIPTIPPGGDAEVFGNIRRVLEGESIHVTEVRRLTKSGNAIDVTVSAGPVRDAENHVVGAVAIYHDIGRRKQAERDLRLRERELETILDNTRDFIVRFDSELRHVYVNRALTQAVGISAEEYLGRTNEELGMPAEACAEWNRELRKAFDLASPHTFSFDFRPVDGVERTYQSHVVPEFGPDGRVATVLSVVRDVTELRRAELLARANEKRFKELTAYLEQVLENERRHIARDIHDQLGQHLSSISLDLARLGLIIEKSPESPERTRSWDITSDMRATIAQTVKDIRRISARLRPGILDDFGLGAAIDSETREFAARAGIECEVDLRGAEHPVTEPQATQLFRIFRECLTNISRHAGAKRVDVRLTRVDDTWRLDITDDGKGFDMAEADRPTSLGLIGMKERAARLGGQLTMESSPGKGTRVRAEVPARIPEVVTEAEGVQP